jgi:hypothetical protein
LRHGFAQPGFGFDGLSEQRDTADGVTDPACSFHANPESI